MYAWSQEVWSLDSPGSSRLLFFLSGFSISSSLQTIHLSALDISSGLAFVDSVMFSDQSSIAYNSLVVIDVALEMTVMSLQSAHSPGIRYIH